MNTLNGKSNTLRLFTKAIQGWKNSYYISKKEEATEITMRV